MFEKCEIKSYKYKLLEILLFFILWAFEAVVKVNTKNNPSILQKNSFIRTPN